MVVFGLVLAACQDADHTHPTTAEIAPTAPVIHEDTPEWGFLRDIGIYSRGAEVDPLWTDDEWLEFGGLICDLLDAGASMDLVLDEMGAGYQEDWPMSYGDTIAITIYGLVASADNLCPEYAGDIAVFLETP